MGKRRIVEEIRSVIKNHFKDNIKKLCTEFQVLKGIQDDKHKKPLDEAFAACNYKKLKSRVEHKILPRSQWFLHTYSKQCKKDAGFNHELYKKVLNGCNQLYNLNKHFDRVN